MIPYEDLVAALTYWRERNGLPTGAADYLGEPPPPPPVSFEQYETPTGPASEQVLDGDMLDEQLIAQEVALDADSPHDEYGGPIAEQAAYADPQGGEAGYADGSFETEEYPQYSEAEAQPDYAEPAYGEQEPECEAVVDYSGQDEYSAAPPDPAAASEYPDYSDSQQDHMYLADEQEDEEIAHALDGLEDHPGEPFDPEKTP